MFRKFMNEVVSADSAGVVGRRNPAAAMLFVLVVAIGAVGFVAAIVFTPASATGGMASLTRSPLTLLLLLVFGPIAALAFGLATWRWPQLPIGALVFLCVLFCDTIERISLSLGFFRLYLHDILIGLAFLSLVLRLPGRKSALVPAGPLGRLIVIAVLLGAIEAVRGMALGNDFSAAFGDFRRGYFYMLVFFLVLAEGSERTGLRWVHRAFLLGAFAVAGRGLYRLTLGNLYQLSWFDVFHVLSHSDLAFVILLSCYCFSRLVHPAPGHSRRPWLLLLPITLVLIVLGNFRASWVGFAMAGVVMGILLPKPKRRVLVAATVPLLIVVAAGLYAFRGARIGQHGETLQEEVVSKFSSLLDWRRDTNVIWRVHSYRAALRIWSEHPVLGAGLGRRLVFHSINAAGDQAIHFNHRAHNSLLWVGFTTGAVGMVVFLALHLTYFFGAVRRLKALGERPEAGVLLAYIGFYVAFMITALFDVILEESPSAITMYAHMGVVYGLGGLALCTTTDSPGDTPLPASEPSGAPGE